jgi:hypothetical protein
MHNEADYNCLGAMLYLAVSVFGKFDFQHVIDFHRNDQGSISNAIPTTNEWKNELISLKHPIIISNNVCEGYCQIWTHCQIRNMLLGEMF